jgi:hypothetical protein
MERNGTALPISLDREGTHSLTFDTDEAVRKTKRVLVLYLKCSRRWKSLCSPFWRRVHSSVDVNVSDKHTVSIFRAEDEEDVSRGRRIVGHRLSPNLGRVYFYVWVHLNTPVYTRFVKDVAGLAHCKQHCRYLCFTATQCPDMYWSCQRFLYVHQSADGLVRT